MFAKPAHAHNGNDGVDVQRRGRYMRSMQIAVRYFAAARDAAGCADDVVEVVAGATVAAVRAQLARTPALAMVLPRCRLAMNQQFVVDEDAVVVVCGAEIAVIPPVAGG